MPTGEKAIPTRIYIAIEQHRVLVQLAEAEDRSVNYLVRRAIDEYLERRAIGRVIASAKGA